MDFRIPVKDEYAILIGGAVYSFAYYEWQIIYLNELLENGYVNRFSRAKRPATSRNIQEQFASLIRKNSTIEYRDRLSRLDEKFSKLIDFRNALIHAHPATVDNEQRLIYQSGGSSSIADKCWQPSDIEQFITDIQDESYKANELFHEMKI